MRFIYSKATLLPFLAAALVLFIPAVASAELVPCDGPECGVCDFVQLGQNILEFLVKIGVTIAAIGFAIGGYYMVTSAGDTSKVGKARQIFTNVVIGLIILIAAWLIIDTVMKLLVDESELEGYGPWNEFTCGGATTGSFNSTGNPNTNQFGYTVVGSNASNLQFTEDFAANVPPQESTDWPKFKEDCEFVGGSVVQVGGSQGGSTTYGCQVSQGGSGGGLTPVSATDPATQLGHDNAKAQLAAMGIGVKEGSGAADLQGLRQSTVNALGTLNDRCSCTFVVTEGTGGNHSTRTEINHANGYKADIRTRDNQQLVDFVRSLPSVGQWSDGTKLYKLTDTVTIADEADHLDLVEVDTTPS